MNLLITGAWQQAPDYLPQIKALGHNVVFLQCENDELPCTPEWVEGVVCNGLFLSHPIEVFRKLKYIQLTSAGFDRVPMEYVRDHNITIHNARGVYSIPMAEFAVAGVLQLYKKMSAFYESQKEHEWNKQRDLRELAGKTVAIIGCGSVGTECAKRFRAFDTTILGVNLFQRKDDYYDAMVDVEKIDQVLKQSDIIVLTLPLTDETRGLMNENRIKAMKDGSVIVNISRGAVVETQPLIERLQTGEIGAVLDVFEEEPLNEGSRLWNMVNTVITPHNSFVGEGNGTRLSQVIMIYLEDKRRL